MEFKHTQLANGLTIIAEVAPQARSMAIGFFTRTGARDETPEISGVSHFLEHMMFKGTDKRTSLEVNLEFDDMGAKYNAFTSEENTVYYAAVLPEYQQRVLALWADLMRPALREEDFDIEKGVILEEIAMYQDLPHFDVFDKARRLHFGEHCCGNSVLGTVESIKALRVEQMREYFRHRYAPDNIVLTAAGNVDWDALVAQASELCGHWPAAGSRRTLTDFGGTGQIQATPSEKIQREHLCLVTAGPCEQSPQRFAASVLSNIIGDDTGSRFYWALVDKALADSADMEYDSMDGTGAFYTYISCDPERSGQIIAVIKDIYRQVREKGVTNQELTAAKNKIASGATLHGELPMGRLVPLGFGWIYRQEYHRLAEEIKLVQSVTVEDIQRLLEQYPLEVIAIQGLGPVAALP